MRRALFAAGLILACSSPALAQKQLVLLATVTDPSGNEISTIDPKDVRVAENGQPATVVAVDAVQRVPKLQVLLDTGVGIPAESIGDLRKALQSFIAELPPALEVTLVTTAPQPRVLEKATSDRAKLLQAVSRVTPDSGAGHFVDALAEAMDRVNKDKQPDSAYTIFALATTAGDNNVRDSDLKKIMQLVQLHHTTVHTVVLNKTGSGRIQLDVGQDVARVTGGRFEIINVPNRILTLMPEIGAQIAKASSPGAKQLRITADRPAGLSGDPGGVTLGIAGKVVTGVTLDAGPARR